MIEVLEQSYDDRLVLPATEGLWVSDFEHEYQFYYTARDRKELATQCQNVANYIYANSISAVALIDGSTRPMWLGLREYWKGVYGEERPMPAIYFLNPWGFLPQNDKKLVDREHPFLSGHKQQPILLFDTCIHSGETIRPVIEGLKAAGFNELHFGVVSDQNNSSSIQPDLVATDSPNVHCSPFGNEFLVCKTDNHIYSERDSRNIPEDHEHQRQLRTEIRRVVRQYLVGQC